MPPVWPLTPPPPTLSGEFEELDTPCSDWPRPRPGVHRMPSEAMVVRRDSAVRNETPTLEQ